MKESNSHRAARNLAAGWEEDDMRMTIFVGLAALLAVSGCEPKKAEAPPPPPPAPAPAPLSGMIIGTVQAASVAKGADGVTLVCAIGKAPTTGYSKPRLELITAAPPADGVYEFNMLVDGPTDPIVMPKEEEFKAQLTWKDAPADVKGVRVKATYGSPATGMTGGASAC